MKTGAYTKCSAGRIKANDIRLKRNVNRCQKRLLSSKTMKANDKRWPSSFCAWQMRWLNSRRILPKCAIRNGNDVIYRQSGAVHESV